jgi:hypothetical protein
VCVYIDDCVQNLIYCCVYNVIYVERWPDCVQDVIADVCMTSYMLKGDLIVYITSFTDVCMT